MHKMVELTSGPGSKAPGIGASDGSEEGGRKPPVLEYTEEDLLISNPSRDLKAEY